MAKTITTPGTPHCPTITAILERSRFKRRYKIYQVILQHLLASSIIFFIVLLQCIHLGEEETEKTSFKSYYPVQISDTNIWYKYSIQISGTRIWYKYPMQIPGHFLGATQAQDCRRTSQCQVAMALPHSVVPANNHQDLA